jgi:hypothetical protein
LEAHVVLERLEELVLPLEVVFLHRLVVVTLAERADSLGAILLKSLVDEMAHGAKVLVGAVAKGEDDIAEVAEILAALAEGDAVVLEEVPELDGVVGRLAFAIGGDDEEDNVVLRDGIEGIKVVPVGLSAVGPSVLTRNALFRIAHQAGHAVPLLGLLGQPGRVVLGGARLRAIEDANLLILCGRRSQHAGVMPGRRRGRTAFFKAETKSRPEASSEAVSLTAPTAFEAAAFLLAMASPKSQ